MRRRCSEYQPLIVTSFPRSGDVIRLLRGSLVSEITLQIATVEIVPCAGVPEPQIPTPMSSNFFICCIVVFAAVSFNRQAYTSNNELHFVLFLGLWRAWYLPRHGQQRMPRMEAVPSIRADSVADAAVNKCLL